MERTQLEAAADAVVKAWLDVMPRPVEYTPLDNAVRRLDAVLTERIELITEEDVHIVNELRRVLDGNRITRREGAFLTRGANGERGHVGRIHANGRCAVMGKLVCNDCGTATEHEYAEIRVHWEDDLVIPMVTMCIAGDMFCVCGRQIQHAYWQVLSDGPERCIKTSGAPPPLAPDEWVATYDVNDEDIIPPEHQRDAAAQAEAERREALWRKLAPAHQEHRDAAGTMNGEQVAEAAVLTGLSVELIEQYATVIGDALAREVYAGSRARCDSSEREPEWSEHNPFTACTAYEWQRPLRRRRRWCC